ncbi:MULTISPECIES: hypothetical protein [unclassified Streptomyces]|uniref:hypothetical protein n=1 Tax=unclassified Streptomyces TaxID=2593676 RepID=UPI0038259DBD
MYLVHARLLGPPGVRLPSCAVELVNAEARPQDGLEHVAVHPDAQPYPVIGLYVRAENLDAAETRAFGVCRRVLNDGVFGGWSLLTARVPMVDSFYEAMLSASGTEASDADGTGHQK